MAKTFLLSLALLLIPSVANAKCFKAERFLLAHGRVLDSVTKRECKALNGFWRDARKRRPDVNRAREPKWER